MEPILIFKELEVAGIALFLTDEGELRYRAPKGSMTDERRAIIHAHRAELVAHLARANTGSGRVEKWTDCNAAYRRLCEIFQGKGHGVEEASRRALEALRPGVDFLKSRAAGEELAQAARAAFGPPVEKERSTAHE